MSHSAESDAGTARQWIDRYECDSCTYETFIPQRNARHYPRGERPLPGQPRAKCPGAVERVRYVRARVIPPAKPGHPA